MGATSNNADSKTATSKTATSKTDDAIERRILALGGRLIAGLEALAGVEVISPRETDAERSGIVGCRIAPDRAPALREALAARAVQCRAGDDGLICLSPHFYNSEAEIDRALEVIGEHAG